MTDVKTCKIRLDFERRFGFLPDTFTAIKTLTALQKVTLVIAVISDPASMGKCMKGPQPDVDREMYLDMHFAIDEDDVLALEWVAGVLEQSLGSV